MLLGDVMGDCLFWVDMEFTGLDVERDVVLEIACLVTDNDLNIVALGPEIAVHQPEDVLSGMDEWNARTHAETGLLKRVRESGHTVGMAEGVVLDFLRAHVEPRASPLCGNSVHVDRMFLRRHMPEVEEYVHYRNVDVSTIKELCRRWYPDLPAFEKKGSHKAMEDIMGSVEELRHYRDNIFR
jgi:oligoribonuclease